MKARLVAALTAAWFVAAGCSQDSSPGTARFVGRSTCVPCHQQEVTAFTGSDHDLAMDTATEATVLGNFNDARLTVHDITSQFFKRDGNFYVRTEGERGVEGEFQVLYTFGVWPLQQYLVAFPGRRLQALPLCWDARPADSGGQRWFHLYGEERIAPSDELYWTRVSQTWNYQCAECHSTDLQKNYDPASRTYATTWSEIDVSCEACHGPGSRHVEWAEKAESGDTLRWDHAGLVVDFEKRSEVEWLFASGDSIAHRSRAPQGLSQVEACAQCHSRRSSEATYVHGAPLLTSHRPALLDERLYFPDGQIREEVYEYGSFLQSKMYKAGVVCGDCHEPHRGTLRVEGDGLCQSCHRAETFAVREHHFHNPDSAGARCVNCHMPERRYMQVDRRADHSFGIPRPDLSESLGVPNACTSCHLDRSASWAAETVTKWYGTLPKHRFSEPFAAALLGDPRATGQLSALAADGSLPAIVRATSIRLASALGQNAETVRAGLRDPDPLVRATAAEAGLNLSAQERLAWLWPALADSVRLVRAEAARSLADLPRLDSTRTTSRVWIDAVAEYAESQMFNAEFPAAWLNLGNMQMAAADYPRALESFQTAIELDSSFIPGYVNLADLYREMGDDVAGRAVLEAALERQPDQASAHHALAMLLVRSGHTDSALVQLERAHRTAPADASIELGYALALHSLGRLPEAKQVVREALDRHPFAGSLHEMAVSLALESGDREGALSALGTLLQLYPNRGDYLQLEAELRQQTQPGGRP